MRVFKLSGILAASAVVLALAACNPNPVVESVDPKSGPESGPTPITVKGKNFKQGAKITADGAALETKFVSATQLTAELSGGAPAQVKIGAENPGGHKAEKTVTFEYTDMTAPAVVSMDPAGPDVEADAAVNTVSVTYSENVDPATAIAVMDDKGAAVEGASAVTDATVTFTPTAAPLPAGKTYTVTVTGAKDMAGNAAEADYSATFTIKKGKK